MMSLPLTETQSKVIQKAGSSVSNLEHQKTYDGIHTILLGPLECHCRQRGPLLHSAPQSRSASSLEVELHGQHHPLFYLERQEWGSNTDFSLDIYILSVASKGFPCSSVTHLWGFTKNLLLLYFRVIKKNHDKKWTVRGWLYSYRKAIFSIW